MTGIFGSQCSGTKKFIDIVSAFPGFAHRRVRISKQGLRMPAILWKRPDANTRRDVELLMINKGWSSKYTESLLLTERRIFCLFNIGKQYHEFVVTHVADSVRMT